MNRFRIDKKGCFFLKGLAAFCLGFSIILVFSQFVTFVVSETDSLPCHYFLKFKMLSPTKGDYTVVFSQWYKGKILKKIIGQENDKIWYDNQGHLWVNDFKVGKPKLYASDGRPLTPLRAQIIPKDYVFLYSSHELSFDSRYQELGLVPLPDLKGKVISLC